jgi:hypothetical protein
MVKEMVARRRIGAVLFMSLIAACGSRTGLFGPGASEASIADLDAAADADADAADSEPDGALPCVPGRFPLQLATAQLMFVIDRSGSMDVALDGTDPAPPGGSRWEVLRAGLAQALTGFDGQIAMGAKFFPGRSAVAALQCVVEEGVEFEPRLGNASSILDVFDESAPRGGTPTADALRIAADHVSRIRGVARTLVLATDGAPNCNFDHARNPCVCTSPDPDACDSNEPSLCLDDRRTIDTIRRIAEDQKVPVYVIGIGSLERAEFRRVLDDMAVAGGRAKPTAPRYYSAQTSAELQGALGSVRDSVGSCTFLTPSAPTDPNAIAVAIGPQAIPRDPTRTSGWDWVDQAYGTIAFFGDACALARSAASELSGVVECD